MSSPRDRRSPSRDRSVTPIDHRPTDSEAHAQDHGISRGRSYSRSPSNDGRRERSRSYRSRTYTRSPSSSDRADIPQSAKIVIEKLTKNVNEAHLHEIFGNYGDIKELEMPTNRQFMMNKGIAYILFADAEQAADAIANLHEAQLDGATISVSIVLPRRRFSRSPPPKRPPPNRFGEPHRFRDGPPRPPPNSDRAYGGRAQSGRFSPPPRRPIDKRARRNSPVMHGDRAPYGGGYGYQDRDDDRRAYRRRDYSRSQSPPSKRRRSRSRSHSRPRHSPSRREPTNGRGHRRRSPSYSSFGGRSHSPDDRR